MTSEQSKQEPKPTLTDTLRVRFKHLLDGVGTWLNNLGITPNMITVTGLVGNLLGATLVSQGYLTIGGLVLLVMGALDAVDGTMARLRGEPTDWGAFIDSVADRYSELFVYIGLSVYFLDLNDRLMLVMTFLAATGSVMVSYTRARALSLGYEIKTGMLTRMERYFILTPTVIIGYPQIGVVIIGIFANLTALQRVMAMRRQSGGSEGN